MPIFLARLFFRSAGRDPWSGSLRCLRWHTMQRPPFDPECHIFAFDNVPLRGTMGTDALLFDLVRWCSTQRKD